MRYKGINIVFKRNIFFIKENKPMRMNFEKVL